MKLLKMKKEYQAKWKLQRGIDTILCGFFSGVFILHLGLLDLHLFEFHTFAVNLEQNRKWANDLGFQNVEQNPSFFWVLCDFEHDGSMGFEHEGLLLLYAGR